VDVFLHAKLGEKDLVCGRVVVGYTMVEVVESPPKFSNLVAQIRRAGTVANSISDAGPETSKHDLRLLTTGLTRS
jgi:hypothetical protein